MEVDFHLDGAPRPGWGVCPALAEALKGSQGPVCCLPLETSSPEGMKVLGSLLQG